MAAPKRPRDPNQLAKLIVDISTGETPPDPKPTEAQTWGSQGGIKGGAARAKALSRTKRQEIAKKAANARWRKS